MIKANLIKNGKIHDNDNGFLSTNVNFDVNDVNNDNNNDNNGNNDSNMYWNIIDSDTLTIGRSTPAFIDKFSKFDHDEIVASSPISPDKIINESDDISQTSSSLSSSLSSVGSKSNISYFRIEEEDAGDDASIKDSPKLFISSNNDAILHALEDNHVLLRSETSSPSIVFDVPSINIFQFDNDSQNENKNDISIVAVDNSEINQFESNSINSTKIEDVLLPQDQPLLSNNDESNKGVENRDEDLTVDNLIENGKIASKFLNSESLYHSITNENILLVNSYSSCQYAVEKDQKCNFTEKRSRASSADEDLAILKKRTINHENGFISSIIKISEKACLKVKDFFIAYFLGNIIYDQKSPLPYLLSHTLAFLVGAFVGRRMLLHPPNPIHQSNAFFIPNNMSLNSQSNEITYVTI